VPLDSLRFHVRSFGALLLLHFTIVVGLNGKYIPLQWKTFHTKSTSKERRKDCREMRKKEKSLMLCFLFNKAKGERIYFVDIFAVPSKWLLYFSTPSHFPRFAAAAAASNLKHYEEKSVNMA
jgi:hypothetical protein